MTSAGEGEGPAAGAGLKTFRLTSRHRRIAIGLFLTAVGAVCWGVATLSAKRALAQPTFRSPLFLVYFASAWKILIFPAYLVARLVHTRDKFSLGHSLRSVNFVFYSPFYKFITIIIVVLPRLYTLMYKITSFIIIIIENGCFLILFW